MELTGDLWRALEQSGHPITRRWQVAVVHRGGKVVEVLASTGLIGP